MNYVCSGEQLTSIADAIRAKGGTSGELVFPDGFTGGIADIPVLDTSDATATAEDILNDKTAYVNGVKITGNYTEPIITSTTVSADTDDTTVDAPTGTAYNAITVYGAPVKWEQLHGTWPSSSRTIQAYSYATITTFNSDGIIRIVSNSSGTSGVTIKLLQGNAPGSYSLVAHNNTSSSKTVSSKSASYNLYYSVGKQMTTVTGTYPTADKTIAANGRFELLCQITTTDGVFGNLTVTGLPSSTKVYVNKYIDTNALAINVLNMSGASMTIPANSVTVSIDTTAST